MQTIYHSLYYIPSHETSLHTNQTICNPSLHTNHSFTQTIPSHKPFIISLHTNQIICNTEEGWFVWRDELSSFSVLHIKSHIIWFVWKETIPSHKPSLHTNHPFTQTISSHKPSLHTNQIICNTGNEKWFEWRDGLCEGMVCVERWFLCITFLHTNHPFTPTISSQKPFIIFCITYYLVCVKACNTENDKPSLCTIHPFTQTILSHNPFPSHKPSLQTNHPFTQIITSHKPSIQTNHPFTQTIPSHTPDSMQNRNG